MSPNRARKSGKSVSALFGERVGDLARIDFKSAPENRSRVLCIPRFQSRDLRTPPLRLIERWATGVGQVLLTLGSKKGGNSEVVDKGDVGAVHLQDNGKAPAVWRRDHPVEILVLEVECPDDLA
jgi:hypothetical protein